MKNSQDKSKVFAENNLKQTANIYIKEYPDEIVWNQENNEKYACISTQALSNKGYLKKSENETYIRLTKNQSNIIIEEEITDDCDIGLEKVKIPTSKDCEPGLVYNTILQTLIQAPINGKYAFENNEQTNAGTYDVTAKLANKTDYIWEDGTQEEKTVQCTIKKKILDFNLSPTGEPEESDETIKLGTTTVKLTDIEIENITISLKSSNLEYATANLKSDITGTDNKYSVEINKLATRAANTYITVTVSPTGDDMKNYYSKSKVYTIGKVSNKIAPIPRCNNNYYTGAEQDLVTENIAYQLYNNKHTDIGDDYPVTLKLNYGYVWEETQNNEDIILNCKILKPTVEVYYKSGVSNQCTTNNPKKILYKENYGEPPCIPVSVGYKFKGWYTEDGSKQILPTTQMNRLDNHILNAHWEPDTTTYKVEHYLMDTSGNYPNIPTSTETKYGTTGETLTLSNLKKIDSNYNIPNGIEYSSGKVSGTPVTTTTIKADGSLVIKLYYSRTYGTLTTAKGTYISSVTTKNAVRYYYGATVNNISATLESATGYTYSFSKWTSNNSVISNQTTSSLNFTWPAMSSGTEITLTANATRTAHTYTVVYNKNGGNGTMSNSSHTYDVAKKLNKNTYTRTGYVFDGWSFNSTSYSDEASVTNLTSTNNGTVILYAKWQSLTCTVNYNGTVGNNGWYKSHGTVTLSHGISSDKIQSFGLATTENSNNSRTSITISNDTTGTEYYGYIKLKSQYGSTEVKCNKTIKVDTVAPYICKYSAVSGKTATRFCLKETPVSSAAKPSDPNKNKNGNPISVARWGFAIKDDYELGSIQIIQRNSSGTSLNNTGVVSRLGKQISNEGIWWLNNSTEYNITLTDAAGNTKTYKNSKQLKPTEENNYARCGDAGITINTVCVKD